MENNLKFFNNAEIFNQKIIKSEKFQSIFNEEIKKIEPELNFKVLDSALNDLSCFDSKGEYLIIGPLFNGKGLLVFARDVDEPTQYILCARNENGLLDLTFKAKSISINKKGENPIIFTDKNVIV